MHKITSPKREEGNIYKTASQVTKVIDIRKNDEHFSVNYFGKHLNEVLSAISIGTLETV